MHDCALQNVKMIIAVDRAGIVGDDGETHNGIYDTSFFNGIPNITVFSPSYYSELNKDFVAALYHVDGPVAVRYPRGGEAEPPYDFEATGNDFDIYGNPDAENAIVTYGRLFWNAVKAVRILENDGINVKIIKLNKIIPLPCEAILECNKLKRVHFFEESVMSGSIGEKFGSELCENGFKGEFSLKAFPDCFVKQGDANDILAQYGLDCVGMAKSFLKENEKIER